MTNEEKLALPFGVLHGVALYNGEREPALDRAKGNPEGYIQRRLDITVGWKYYVQVASGYRPAGKVVRATYCLYDRRLVVSGAGAIDVPANCYIVHDESSIWVEDRDRFESNYEPTGRKHQP